MTVRVRFAPSPTGYLHIGSVWTALFTWMYARRHHGQFILRIEDTDTRRTVPGALENLMDGLRWFGIEWDEGPDIGGPYGPYTQTERAPLYQQWAHWLVDNGYAYKCFATAEELAEMRVLLEARGTIPATTAVTATIRRKKWPRWKQRGIPTSFVSRCPWTAPL